MYLILLIPYILYQFFIAIYYVQLTQKLVFRNSYLNDETKNKTASMH